MPQCRVSWWLVSVCPGTSLMPHDVPAGRNRGNMPPRHKRGKTPADTVTPTRMRPDPPAAPAPFSLPALLAVPGMLPPPTIPSSAPGTVDKVVHAPWEDPANPMPDGEEKTYLGKTVTIAASGMTGRGSRNARRPATICQKLPHSLALRGRTCCHSGRCRGL